MAGTPKRRIALAKIAEAGGFNVIYRRVADGETLQEIANSLGIERCVLSTLANKGPNRQRMIEARTRAATVLVEDARDIADRATPEDVQVARLRVDVRTWTAKTWDRQQYGDKPTPQVVVDLREMHLAAARAHQAQLQAQKATRALMPPEPVPDGNERGGG